MNTFSAWALALVLAGAAATGHAQQLRPEIAKPLQAASQLLQAGKAGAALAEVNKADAVGNKTAAESMMIDRMRAAAAQRAGEHGVAIRALEAIFARQSGAEAAQTAEQIAFAYSQIRDNANAKNWVAKAQSLGANSASLRQLQTYLQGASGDYASIAKESAANVAAAERAGRAPTEDDLLRLADAQQRTGNAAGQTQTLEKLLTYYPKKDYWAIYLARVQRKSGFSPRYNLDVMRLKLATGNLGTTEEYMEMAQLALQADFPGEGKSIVDKGFAAGLLGTGPEAERHGRLRDLANKREAEAKAALAQRTTEALAARDGNDLVQIGYAHVTKGETAKGVELIQQGIAKGSLKRPDEAQLRLGMALLATGKDKAKALQVLRNVQGKEGTADIARLWAVYAGSRS